MKLNVGKVVDKMTRAICIPTNSIKSEDDDYFNIFQNIGLGHILIRIRPIKHTRLGRVMKCRVGNI